MGEAFSDYFVVQIDPVIAVFFSAIVLAIALWIQFKAPRYVAWKYWFAVAMVAVFGTMMADVLHKVIGIPYSITTAAFAFGLFVIFLWWYHSEKTLSIHSITSKRRELFYWATVMATFALGTAAGDLTAYTLGMGYLMSGLFFLVLIAVPAVVYFKTKKAEVLWFWAAYILTRPVGASFADWFGKAPAIGGLGWGDGTVSLLLAVGIVVLVAVESRRIQRTAY